MLELLEDGKYFLFKNNLLSVFFVRNCIRDLWLRGRESRKSKSKISR